MAVASHVKIAKARDGDFIRHLPTAPQAFLQGAKCGAVRDKHDRVRIRPAAQYLDDGLAALFYRNRRSTEPNDPGIVQSIPMQGLGEPLLAISAAGIAG